MLLTVKKGREVIATEDLSPPIVIGREPSCDLPLDDRRASRRHARIFEEDGLLLLEDLGSTNGTWLNGRRISGPSELRPGDVVSIGSTNIVLGDASAGGGRPSVEDLPTGELRTIAFEPEAALRKPSDLGRAYERLLALYRLAGRASSARSVPELFKETAEIAAGILETDRVIPVLLENGVWRPLASRGKGRGALARTIEKVPVSRSILDAAAKSLRPVIMARRKGEKFRSRRSIRELGITTALAAPLAVGKELLGVLYADRFSDAPEFSDEDLEWLAAAARLVSGALLGLLNRQRLSARARSLEDMLAGDISMIGESPSMQAVRRLVEASAAVDSPVLITGESGTGKELVARLIHFSGPRAEGPFVVLNCAALPESLAESELFGHVKGAFTGAVEDKAGRFELARGGTVFLDEVAELPLSMQVKLLRVLETGEYQRVGEGLTRRTDARVLCATNRDVEAMVGEGSFREDLYYRLNVLRVTVPPLRERREDIPLLLDHYLSLYADKMGRKKPELHPEALRLFTSHPWPGNVRELRNAVERLMVLLRSDSVTREDAALVLGGPPAPSR